MASALRQAIDREHNAELANAVSATEIMIVDFYKTGRLGRLSQLTGQIFLDMAKHPLFDPGQRYPQRNYCASAQATRAAICGNSDAYLQLMAGRGWKSAVGTCCARLFGAFSPWAAHQAGPGQRGRPAVRGGRRGEAAHLDS